MLFSRRHASYQSNLMRMSLQAGLTLIELIVAIIMLAVMGIAVSTFIALGTDMYVDVAGREQLLSNSRFAIDRLTREVRASVPNSVRIRTDSVARIQCVEFLPRLASGSYVTLPVDPLIGQEATLVRVNNYSPDFSQANYLATYALEPSQLYSPGTRSQRFQSISALAADQTQRMTFCDLANCSGPADVTFATASPSQRFYIYDDQPVSYCVRDDSLWRHQGYGLQASQPLFSSDGVLMAEQLHNNLQLDAELPFVYAEPTLNRSSLLLLYMKFTRDDRTEPMEFSHAIHIPNVP